MDKVRWGIIGPGRIAHNFADGLKECDSGVLTAIASRTEATRASFGDDYGIAPGKRYDSYDALIADPEVDAIYIATPHPFHAQPALDAIRGGKAVVVEKPMSLIAAETIAITEAAAQAGTFLMEGMMYRCHPQIARLVELIREGAIGEVRHIRASFGFAASFKADSRLFDASLAGGGILDVGIYPVSLARLVAGVAAGGEIAEPLSVKGAGILGQSGVDEVSYGLLTFPGGVTAEIACAVSRNMTNDAVVEGTTGTIRLPDPWMPGRDKGPSDAVIEITSGGETREEWLRDPRILFAHEAELASRAIREGRTEAPFPAPTPADTVGTSHVLDRWRAELGPAAPLPLRHLRNVLPEGLPQVPTRDLPGLDRPLNALILGCDNRDTPAEGAVTWDAWMEAGGRSFDTAFVYGAGRHEAALGAWIAERGVANEVTVIVKGAHSPYCIPRAIGMQLGVSLERLGLDRAPIYIMHRDNPDVPVGEFVDAVSELHAEGRIGIWGGSNWTTDRFAEAVAHAEATGGLAPSILNNNLSLAVMEKPVWPGCITSNEAGTLAFLRSRNVAHVSWSSQARGYFLPRELRDRLPEDTRPETCFGSEANAERRRRAEEIVSRQGVSAHNVATAWVLAQSFPSFALIGPRSPGEIASTLPGLAVTLTPEEVAWLNLED